jgi:alanine racemase
VGVVRPTRVEVDLAAIRANVAAIRTAVEPASVCAVVKADAYGHGDVPVAGAAIDAGADRLAVALIAEGARLREAGIEAPILLLSEPFDEAVAQVVEWRLTPTVYRAAFLDALEEVAPEGYPVHVKVDTGMHRVGAAAAEAESLARRIAASPLRLEGLWTHFAVAEEDSAFTTGQADALGVVVDRLAVDGIRPDLVHAANTAGALGHPAARLDMVRVGLGIYGLRPAPGMAPDVPLTPAMRVTSRVALTRSLPAGARPSYGRRRPLPADSTVAVVPIGYADGLPRRLGERDGVVLIRGRRYPFAGSVTMDQIIVDLGADPAAVGDEVVLLGAQGDDEITAEEWAERLSTISYEVVCGFGPRMPRRYRS